MPWIPELFSAPTLERIRAKGRRDRLSAVPYFAGLMAGETDALIGSFAGELELHHPVRGRVKGARAFERFVVETNAWLAERNAAFDDVDLVVSDLRTVEEVVLRLDAGAVVSLRGSGQRIENPFHHVEELPAPCVVSKGLKGSLRPGACWLVELHSDFG